MELNILISALTVSLTFMSNTLMTCLYSSIYPIKSVMKDVCLMQLWHFTMGEKDAFFELLDVAGR